MVGLSQFFAKHRYANRRRALPYTIACISTVASAQISVQVYVRRKIYSSERRSKTAKHFQTVNNWVVAMWCMYKTSYQHDEQFNSTLAIRLNVCRELKTKTIFQNKLDFFLLFNSVNLKWLIFGTVVGFTFTCFHNLFAFARTKKGICFAIEIAYNRESESLFDSCCFLSKDFILRSRKWKYFELKMKIWFVVSIFVLLAINLVANTFAVPVSQPRTVSHPI